MYRGNHSNSTSGQTAGGTGGHLAVLPDRKRREGSRGQHCRGEERKEGIKEAAMQP